MAGYVKIWTTLRTNRKFLSLNCNGRGMFMQLLLACKDQRDDGQVWYKNVAQMSQDCGMDPRTSVKVLHTLSIDAANMLITYNINPDGTVVIDIANYKIWQELDAKGVQSRKRNPATKLQPLRPDQTKAEQTRLEQRDIPLNDKKVEKQIVVRKDDIPYEQIIDDLNLIAGRTGTHLFQKTQQNKKRIATRWNELTGLDDETKFKIFQYVHRVKGAEWLPDPKMSRYFRPATLYSPKFEEYRMQELPRKEETDTERKNREAGEQFLAMD